MTEVVVAVFGYTRVSTVQQSTEGESLLVQERTITGYAMMHGLSVDRLFCERAVSGSKPLGERPEGSVMLAALKPGDIIITAKLDRMFRSALDALAVLDNMRAGGISLHMIDLGGDVTGNGISKLVFTILSAVAEAERDRTRERVASVKADQKARGRYLGGIMPFGKRLGDSGELVDVPAEQAAIVMMRSMRHGGASLRAIAAEMQKQGFSLSHEAVRGILTR